MKAKKVLRASEMLLVLRGEVARYKTDREAAQRLGVSQAFLCDVLRERRSITAKLALALGYERQFLYVPYEEQR